MNQSVCFMECWYCWWFRNPAKQLRLVVEIPLFRWFYVLLEVSSGVLVQVAPSPKQDTQGIFANANLPSFQGLIRTRLSEGDFLGTPESRRQPKLFVFFFVGVRKFFFFGGKASLVCFLGGFDLIFLVRICFFFFKEGKGRKRHGFLSKVPGAKHIFQFHQGIFFHRIYRFLV